MPFPTFGKADESDPLQYVERGEDFLGLNPLTDEGLMATLCNVLPGTSRDPIKSKPGNNAFLSGDYEDELAERVRSTVQKEAESIRDLAYTYQSLCKRWKPTISYLLFTLFNM